MLPLVYACSGCSNSGQMANVFATRLDRAQWAEMGCLSGVAGAVAPIIEKARKAVSVGRSIWVIDGCPYRCGKSCLDQRGLNADKSLVLTEYGFIKKNRSDLSPVEADRIFMDHVLPDLGLVD